MKILVTGGSGFLAQHLIHGLVQQGYTDLRIFNRRASAEMLKKDFEISYGDLCDAESVATAVRGCEVVFHVAAKAGIWGSYQSYYKPNVIGTQNVLKACQRFGVKKLIYTSTPSVVFNGQPLANVSERVGYGHRGLCAYEKTKIIAEKIVLAANRKNNLLTIALRPHLMWGPGDRNLIPTLLQKVKHHRLFQVGNGENWVDLTYVENAAQAHILAMQSLGQRKVDGKAYFISQNDPVQLWEWIRILLQRLQLPAVTKKIPYPLAYFLGLGCEGLYKLFCIQKQPPMTRFLAKQLAYDHYFDISAAKMDLTFLPQISNEEGLERLIAWIKESKYLD